MKRKALYLGLSLGLLLAACGEDQQTPTALPTLGPTVIPAPVPIRQSVVTFATPIATNNPAIIDEAGDLEIVVTVPTFANPASLPNAINVAGATFIRSSTSRQTAPTATYTAQNPTQGFFSPIGQIIFTGTDFVVTVSLRTTSRSPAGANPLPGYQNIGSVVSNFPVPTPFPTATQLPTLQPLPSPAPLPTAFPTPLPSVSPSPITSPTPVTGLTVTAAATAGSTTLILSSVTGVSVGQLLTVGTFTTAITAISGTSVTLATALAANVAAGTPVTVANATNLTITAANPNPNPTSLTLGNVTAAGIKVPSFISVSGEARRVTAISGNTITLNTALTGTINPGTLATIVASFPLQAQVESTTVNVVPASAAALFVVGDGVEIAGATSGNGVRTITGIAGGAITLSGTGVVTPGSPAATIKLVTP